MEGLGVGDDMAEETAFGRLLDVSLVTHWEAADSETLLQEFKNYKENTCASYQAQSFTSSI